MTQLYARVFLQILDSSLSEDWQARHVFEDLLKLACDGEVDMTREAICRRTNVPRDVLDRAISVLEAPDARSRNPAEDGRRLVRLDDHRDWGWRIVNWDEYEAIRSKDQARQKAAERNRRYRERQAKKEIPPHPPKKDTETYTDTDTEAPSRERNGASRSVTPPSRFTEPTPQELELEAAKNGLPANEVEKFLAYYQSNGWRVGRNPMKSWRAALSNWKARWQERRHVQSSGALTTAEAALLREIQRM